MWIFVQLGHRYFLLFALPVPILWRHCHTKDRRTFHQALFTSLSFKTICAKE